MQIRLLVLIAAVLAMAAAMGAMIWQRRPRLADMKVDGFRKGVLWRALLIESALLLGAGCSVGAVFGVYGQVLLSHALASVTGFPVDLLDRCRRRDRQLPAGHSGRGRDRRDPRLSCRARAAVDHSPGLSPKASRSRGGRRRKA